MPEEQITYDSLLVALHPAAVAVNIAGEVFLIEEAGAADWIEVLTSGVVADLFSIDDQRRFDDLLDEGVIEVEEMNRAFYDAIEVASGREWYVAARIIAGLSSSQVRGEVFSCIDVNTASLAAVCDVTYAITVRWMDEKKRKKFDDQLNAAVSVTPQVTDMREYAQWMRERSAAARDGASDTPSLTSRPRTPQ